MWEQLSLGRGSRNGSRISLWGMNRDHWMTGRDRQRRQSRKDWDNRDTAALISRRGNTGHRRRQTVTSADSQVQTEHSHRNAHKWPKTGTRHNSERRWETGSNWQISAVGNLPPDLHVCKFTWSPSIQNTHFILETPGTDTLEPTPRFLTHRTRGPSKLVNLWQFVTHQEITN